MRKHSIKLGLDGLLGRLAAQTNIAEAGNSYALITAAEYLNFKRIDFQEATALYKTDEFTDTHRIVAVLFAGAVPKLREDSVDLVVTRLAADTADSDELAARCYIQVGDLTISESPDYAFQSYSSAIRRIGSSEPKLRGPCLSGLAKCWLIQGRLDEAAKAASAAKDYFHESDDDAGSEGAALIEVTALLGSKEYAVAASVAGDMMMRQREHGVASGSVDATTILSECIKGATGRAFGLAQAGDAAAVDAYDSAMALAGETGYRYPEEADHRCLLGQALVMAGKTSAGQGQLELAVEKARTAGSSPVLLKTLIGLADWLRCIQDPRAIALCKEALALAEKLNDEQQIVDAQLLLGSALQRAGEIDAGCEYLERASSYSKRPAYRVIWILALFDANREKEALSASAALDAELAALPDNEIAADSERLSTLIRALINRGHTGVAQPLSVRLEKATGALPNTAEAGTAGSATPSKRELRDFNARGFNILSMAGTRLMSGDLAGVVAALEPLLAEAQRRGALIIELHAAYMLSEAALNDRRFEDSLRLLGSMAEKSNGIQPALHANALNKIGTAYTQMGKSGVGLFYQQAAISAHRALEDWPALVIDLIQAAQSCVPLNRLEEAQIYADEIDSLGPKYPPADADFVTSVPALVAARRGQWDKAKPKFRATIAELERKREQFRTADQQRAWGRQKADNYGQAIQAAIMANDGEEAVMYLELARNRYLNAIAREKATLTRITPATPDGGSMVLGAPTAESLARLLPWNCAFVCCAVFVDGMGIVAASWNRDKVELACSFIPEITHEFVARMGHGESGEDPRNLLEAMVSTNREGVTEDQLQTGEFWQSGSGEQWPRTIERIVDPVRSIIWPRILEPLQQAAPVLVLLPSVGCTELPLAAAAPDRWPNGAPLSLCFAPSLASLTPLTALGGASPQRLSQVENPSEDASLVCCSLECEAAGKLFPTKPEVIRGRRARRGRILETIANADVFHFMGHAWCDWHEPLDSGLLCARRSDEPDSLTVRDLFSAGHIKPRLIVLSACEVSNLRAGDKQNDFINLPAALIALGARCVVAPRWRVNDVAASMLVANLFERWLSGASILEALAGARQWLRDEVSRSTVETWLEKSPPEGPDSERLKLVKKSLQDRYKADEQPFGHVMHWGAFEAMGDPYPFGVNHA